MEGFENPGRSHLGNGEVGSAADDDIIHNKRGTTYYELPIM